MTDPSADHPMPAASSPSSSSSTTPSLDSEELMFPTATAPATNAHAPHHNLPDTPVGDSSEISPPGSQERAAGAGVNGGSRLRDEDGRERGDEDGWAVHRRMVEEQERAEAALVDRGWSLEAFGDLFDERDMGVAREREELVR